MDKIMEEIIQDTGLNNLLKYYNELCEEKNIKKISLDELIKLLETAKEIKEVEISYERTSSYEGGSGGIYTLKEKLIYKLETTPSIYFSVIKIKESNYHYTDYVYPSFDIEIIDYDDY